MGFPETELKVDENISEKIKTVESQLQIIQKLFRNQIHSNVSRI